MALRIGCCLFAKQSRKIAIGVPGEIILIFGLNVARPAESTYGTLCTPYARFAQVAGTIRMTAFNRIIASEIPLRNR